MIEGLSVPHNITSVRVNAETTAIVARGDEDSSRKPATSGGEASAPSRMHARTRRAAHRSRTREPLPLGGNDHHEQHGWVSEVAEAVEERRTSGGESPIALLRE